MKKLSTLLFVLILILGHATTKAQSFTVISDTIHITGVSGQKIYYDSIVTGSTPVTYSWKVIACNFPVAWMSDSVSGFCDNNVCRYLDLLWPSGQLDTTAVYHASDTGTLELALDLPAGTPTGCYYVTARLHNIAAYSDSTTETWIICYTSTGVPAISNAGTSLTISPNPSHGAFTLNISSPQKEEATITITNIVGEKVKELIATTNTNINLQLNAPAGLYFVNAVTKNGSVCKKVEVE